MKKIFLAIVLAITALAYPSNLSAKQTLEEAADSIKNVYLDAKKGVPAAMNTVGNWYYRGRHVDQDYKLAAQWWAKAAKAGDVKAIGNLGLCYQTGNGVEADSVRAAGLYTRSIKEGNKKLLERLVESANKGNVFSQVFVAQCLQNGVGVKKNPEKAAEYYAKAARKGSVDADRELGVMLLNTKKYTDALKYFKDGAKKDDLACTFFYGKMTAEGMGTKKDPVQGMIQMQKAAEGGFANAQLYLGKAYYEGNGVRKDPAQGYKWLRDAAQNGNSNAMFQTALKLVAGDGCTLDYDQATLWFGKAVAAGHKGAFKKLFAKDGELAESPYLTYLRVRELLAKDQYEEANKALKPLKKSKDKAVALVGESLEAYILCIKDNPKINLKKGVKELAKCAEKGSATADYILGVLYDQGKQVKADKELAVSYLTAATELNNPLAASDLGDMYFEGRGVEQDYYKAVECYRVAGQLITEAAAKHLAACYENGYGGLEPDKKKAETLLKEKYTTNASALFQLLP